jgi:hypothetical protein
MIQLIINFNIIEMIAIVITLIVINIHLNISFK